jgi:aerobic-type carbon monoxide dehydrogenase small subunit (CoxS/CutS family)
MDQELEFQLNGERVSYTGSATTRLLDVLRDNFALTALSAVVRKANAGLQRVTDGKLVNSCMVAMGRVAGASIVTIEGLQQDRTLCRAQCGICSRLRCTVWLLHSRHDPRKRSHPSENPTSHRGRDSRGNLRQSLPLHGI